MDQRSTLSFFTLRTDHIKNTVQYITESNMSTELWYKLSDYLESFTGIKGILAVRQCDMKFCVYYVEDRLLLGLIIFVFQLYYYYRISMFLSLVP